MYFIVIWISYVFHCFFIYLFYCFMISAVWDLHLDQYQAKLMIYKAKKGKITDLQAKMKNSLSAICFVHKMKELSLFGLTFGRKRSLDSVTGGSIFANLVLKYPQDNWLRIFYYCYFALNQIMVVQLVLKSPNCTLFRILHSYPEVIRLSQIVYHYWTIPLTSIKQAIELEFVFRLELYCIPIRIEDWGRFKNKWPMLTGVS